MSGQATAGEPSLKPNAPATRARRRRIMLGLLVLVCGTAIGAGGTIIVARRTVQGGMLQAVRHPERTPALIVEHMRRDLGLTDQQAQRMEAIVTRRMTAIAAINEETRPRIEEQFGLMHEEIAKVLDERQRREFRERLKERDGRRHRGPPGRWGPPPGKRSK